MRWTVTGLLLVTALLTAGCSNPVWPRDRRVTMETWMVNDYQAHMTDGAIVSAHTLYPHHFVANGATLNELGRRDVDVLADHYRDNPGHLNIRHGGVSDELYESRVQTVVSTLTDAGVDADRVTIDDGEPGGRGMSSDFVVVVLDVKRDAPLYPDRRSSGTVLSSEVE